MQKIVFATNNKHKLNEVQSLLLVAFEVVGLEEIGCLDDIPETAETLEGNAFLKADYVYKRYGIDCFADDTGLEIEALNGAPGVFSARFAGENKNSEDNMQKVLTLLGEESNRKARFRTVISLYYKGNNYLFEGIVEGIILKEQAGEHGFGYDPIFLPNGYQQSFAQLPMKEKNKISHRARAIQQLTIFLSEKNKYERG